MKFDLVTIKRWQEVLKHRPSIPFSAVANVSLVVWLMFFRCRRSSFIFSFSLCCVNKNSEATRNSPESANRIVPFAPYLHNHRNFWSKADSNTDFIAQFYWTISRSDCECVECRAFFGCTPRLVLSVQRNIQKRRHRERYKLNLRLLLRQSTERVKLTTTVLRINKFYRCVIN